MRYAFTITAAENEEKTARLNKNISGTISRNIEADLADQRGTLPPSRNSELLWGLHEHPTSRADRESST